MRYTNLAGETPEYLTRREELRVAEAALSAQIERVAQLRRDLPSGPVVTDYAFEEGPTDLLAGDTPRRRVRLSELFSAPDRALIIYHLMYGKRQTTPCPMCTMWIDGYNGVAGHLAQNVDFAIAAAADLPALRAHARTRGWRSLRLLSCAGNTFKADHASEDEEGNQSPTISVFTRDGDGAVRHRYTTSPSLADDIDERGIDLLSPVWNLLDLTPQGRGDWYADLEYAE